MVFQAVWVNIFRPSTFVAETLPGHPPKWFVSQILDGVLELDEYSGKFYVRIERDEFQCTPKSVIQKRNDTLFKEIQTGDKNLISLQRIYEYLSGLYPSLEDVQRYVETVSGVEIIENHVVSIKWHSILMRECAERLGQKGWLDLMVSLVVTLYAHWFLV